MSLNSDPVERAIGLSPHQTSQSYAERLVFVRESTNAKIRELVIEFGRIDILAEFVLGYPPHDIHREMMEWQSSHDQGLLLAWRGAAKTTYCTISRCIFEILRDPNVRILLVSESSDQSRVFLSSIKAHFENNKKFRSIFGDYVTGARDWSETRITVNKRTTYAGENTIYCAGIGTSLPSRHFDIIVCDDLVIKKNSVTDGLRKRTFDYFYETLLPTLALPHGKLWVLGTRWHREDLHGWLQENDFAESTHVISVLDDDDNSRWEEQFPAEKMYHYRRANPAAFELQYMLRAGEGVGEIFTNTHFLFYEALPPDVNYWQGVDLAIGQKAQHDFLAHVTLAVQRVTKELYLVRYRLVKMPFPEQVRFIKKQFEEFPLTARIVIEQNNYQAAMRDQLREVAPELPVLGSTTIGDKITRAQRLALVLTNRPLHIKQQHSEFMRLLIGFPGVKGSKDLMDAIDLAVMRGMRGAKKRRRNEPGVF